MPQSTCRGGRDWGLLGDSTWDTTRYTVGILNTEEVVTTRVRAVAPPLPWTDLEKLSGDYAALYQRE